MNRRSHLRSMDPMFSGDSSSPPLDPMFSGISLQSLLTLNPSLYPDCFHFSDDPPQPTTHTPFNKQLLVPKSENPYQIIPNFEQSPQQQQFLNSHIYPPQPSFNNIFPKFHHPQQEQHFQFHRLPDLRSPEDFHSRKRFRHEETVYPVSAPPPPAPAVIPQSHLARQRRQKLSEKTRCLQKLMPWDKKMDQATLLEEACKYVKFLQAQCSVLQSMPTHFASAGNFTGGAGDLERLNRSQILQVLVNSPVAQTVLCSQGLCVFSAEQVALLRKFSERKHHLHQAQQQEMSENGSSKTFFN